MEDLFACILCGTLCALECFPRHREAYSCHNPNCAGHVPLPLHHKKSNAPSPDRQDHHRQAEADTKSNASMSASPSPDNEGRPHQADSSMSDTDDEQESEFTQPRDMHKGNGKGKGKAVTDSNTSMFFRPSHDNQCHQLLPEVVINSGSATDGTGHHDASPEERRQGNGRAPRVEKPNVLRPVDPTRIPGTVTTNFGMPSNLPPLPKRYRVDKRGRERVPPKLLGMTIGVLSDDKAEDLKPSISEIEDGLYLGNLASVQGKDADLFLKKMGITCVITVLSHPVSSVPNHPMLRTIPLKDRLFLRAEDTPYQDLIQYFPGACEFIDQKLVRKHQTHQTPPPLFPSHSSPDAANSFAGHSVPTSTPSPSLTTTRPTLVASRRKPLCRVKPPALALPSRPRRRSGSSSTAGGASRARPPLSSPTSCGRSAGA